MSTDLEFDTLYDTNGAYAGTYVPRVEHDDEHDILIDGVPLSVSEWSAIVGETRQYGYRGAVMHPSETASAETVRQWVEDAGGHTFALVEVSGHDDADPVFPEEPDYCEDYGCAHEPAGWAVIYRPA